MLSSPRVFADPAPRGSDSESVPSDLLAAALALLALVVSLFRECIFSGRVLYERDIHLVWEPHSAAFLRGWRPGSWPLWDDSLGFGQSLVANPQAQVFYPPTWLALALPFSAYCLTFVTGHLLGSGIGVFALGKRLGLAPAAALGAAALWIVSGPFLSSASLWHHFAGAAWAPWVLLGLLAMRRRGDAGGVAVASLPVAGQILAGSADLCALTLVLGAALLVVSEWGGPMRSLRVLVLMATATLVALGLTAGQWLASLETLLRSARADLATATRTYWSVHPAGLLDLALPVQLGMWPLGPEARAALYESREPFVPSLYLGLVALPLVLAGLAHRQRRLVGLLVGVSAAAVLVALGRHAPVYGALTSLVPPFRILRYPVKALFLVGLAWPILAGLGIDVWLGSGQARRPRWALLFAGLAGALALLTVSLPTVTAGLAARWLEPPPAVPPAILPILVRHLGLAAAALGLAALAAWSGRRLARVGMVVLVSLAAVADLAVVLAPLNPTAPASFYAYRPPVFRAVQGGPPGRCYVYDYTAVFGRSERRLGRKAPLVLRTDQPFSGGSVAPALALRSYMYPASASSWGLRYGFDHDMTGLAPRETAHLLQFLWLTEGTPAQLRLLQLGGVSHVVTMHDVSAEGLEPAGEFFEILSDPVRLWRVPDPLPRSLVVGGARVAPPLVGLRLLADGGVDPRREVVLTDGSGREPPSDFQGSVRVLEERPGFLRLESAASHPGHLVILDAFAPGWTASVDGRSVPLVRADAAFRAVAVPAGRHTIESRYLPASVAWGGWLSAAVALAVLGVLVRPGSSNRAGSEPRFSGGSRC